MNGYILISAGWAAYFFLHSLLASEQAKQLLGYPKWYRLAYSVLATVLLVPIFLFLATAESAFVFPKNAVTDFLALVFAAYGVIVIKMSFRHYGLKEFVGLKNDQQEAFKDAGILSKIRHPIYAGTILLVVGFVLFIPKGYNVATACWVFLYLPIGIKLEEKKLIKKYGQQYEDYRKRVPAIFPRLFNSRG